MRLTLINTVFLAIAIFLFQSNSSFAENNPVQLLGEEIDAVLQNSCLADGNAGIKVFSLTKGDVIYQRNSSQFFIPASNIKLLTSAVALKVLGGEYQFLTTVSTDGEIKNNVLHGNLYLKGYGDPRLVSEELWMIVKNIRNRGIKRINGDLIADDTFFDNILTGVGVGKNGGSEPYNARVSALSLNFNTVTIYVNPVKRVGARPIVTVDPPTKYIKVSNKAKTAAKGKGNNIIVGRVNRGGHDTVFIRGSIRTPGYHAYLNVSNPTLYTITVFKEFLEKEGIKIRGNIYTAKQPEDVKKLVIHKSRPLSLIIQDMNKISNNFIAEQVLKTAGAERFGAPGTTRKGLDLINQFMETLGYPPSSYSVVDGSGLSKQNSLSPDQIIDVLKNMYYDFSVRAEYVASLGIMGIDGSLKKRLNKFQKRRYIRAKTGTLNGANSLSGYVGAEGGEELAFSILINSRKCNWNNNIKMQNSIVEKLSEFSRTKIENTIFTNTGDKQLAITPQISYNTLQ